LYEVIGQFKPDEKVVITYLRDNKELTTTATLAKNKATNMGPNYRFNMQPNFRMRPDQQFNFQMPEMEGLMNRMDKKPKIGISIEDLTIGEGVKITDVNEGSAAEKAGLKKNDIILAVNGKKIKDVDAVKAELKIAVEGTKLPIQVKRDKEIKTIELIIPKKIKTANL
jgi:serine protease Do